MSDDYDQQWQCGYCGAWKPVPGMARDCERKHEAEASEEHDAA